MVSASVDPTNDQVAFVASDRGGLWRTANGGQTWTHVDGLPLYAMHAVRHSSRNPNIIIATASLEVYQAPFSTIWRSTNGGVTWAQSPSSIPPIAAPPTGIKSYDIAFSPDSDHVYVGTDFGLAVSSNLGATWTHVDPALGAATDDIGAVLSVDAQPGGIVNIMASCTGGPVCTDALNGTFNMCNGFRRSTNFGATFSVTGAAPLGGAAPFLNAGFALQSIASSPSNPDFVVAMGMRNQGPGATCSRWDAFESGDGGQTWRSLNAPVSGNGRPPFLNAHASRDNVSGHLDVYYGDSVFAYRQTCEGSTPGQRCSNNSTDWERVTPDNPLPGHTDPAGIEWSTTSNCPKFLLTDGGPELSSNCGAPGSWAVTGGGPGGFHALQITDFGGTVHLDTTDLYIGTQDNGNWASINTGGNWRSSDNKSPIGDAFGIEVVHALATHDQTTFSVFCGSCSYVRGNRDWSSTVDWTPPPETRQTSTAMAVAKDVWVQFAQPKPGATNPPTTADHVLYRSGDNGNMWVAVPGATVTEDFRFLDQDPDGTLGAPDRGRTAGTGTNATVYKPVVRDSDGADGLKRVSGINGGTVEVDDADVDIAIARSVVANRPVWAVDPSDPSHLGAVDLFTNQLVFSEESGTDWEPNPLGTSSAHGSGKFLFNVGGQTSVNAIAFDDSNGNRILVGTENNGVLASFDRGTSWIQVPGSESLPSIWDFYFDEGHSDVYVVTVSRGLWKMGWCGNGGGSDTTPPTFAFVPPDITTSNCGTIDIGTARAVDVCGNAGVTITNNRPAKFSPGTTLVTWTARDAAGNVTTATQRVTLLLGDDPACCPTGTTVILGNSNNNTLNGTAGSDCILGRGAQDTINGLGGNDFISGGDGNDVINGGSGNDVIFGGSAQDQLTGDIGDDTLFGGDGDDTVRGSAGNDTLRGGQGQDQLFGDDGNDTLFGNDGNDNLNGGIGNDNLVGNEGSADVCTDASGTNTFATCETAPTNSCDDDLRNGTETDVDCGGGCARCVNGRTCASSNDCQSGVCAGGLCVPSSGIATSSNGLLQASLQITTDWGSGYCAALTVINNAFVPTINWSVNININAATTYTTWNGIFSGNTGPVTVSPASASDQVLAPAASNNNIGFCANRNVPGSGALPAITAASGQYF